MNDFDWDVLQKKRIAQQARRRKGTRGRKGCTLPSDYLTPKQMKERNGPIMTVKLNEPMIWTEFMPLSDTLKLEYLNALKARYKPTTREFAEMFGTSRPTFSKEIARLGFQTGHAKHVDNSKERKEQKEAFKKFWNSETESAVLAIKKRAEEIKSSFNENISAFDNSIESLKIFEEAVKETRPMADMVTGTFNISGTPAEIEEFMDTVRMLLNNDELYSLRIEIRKRRELV